MVLLGVGVKVEVILIFSHVSSLAYDDHCDDDSDDGDDNDEDDGDDDD